MTRSQLASEYDARKADAVAAFFNHGHGSHAHRVALANLTMTAKALHDQERAEGLPIGTTRSGR